MSLTKGVKVVLIFLSVVFVAVVIYGVITDCPNTAGYFFCSESESGYLRQ